MESKVRKDLMDTDPVSFTLTYIRGTASKTRGVQLL